MNTLAVGLGITVLLVFLVFVFLNGTNNNWERSVVLLSLVVVVGVTFWGLFLL